MAKAAWMDQAPRVEPRDSAPSTSGRWWPGVGGTDGLAPTGLAAVLRRFAALFLGVFFFALFGLVIGAAIHRVASPAGPYSPVGVLAGTTLVVLLVFGLSLLKESRDFPSDLAHDAVGRTADLHGRTAAEYRAAVEAEVRAFLKATYPPGRTLGYVRWMAASGEIKKGALPSVHRSFVDRRTARGSSFGLRCPSDCWPSALDRRPCPCGTVAARPHRFPVPEQTKFMTRPPRPPLYAAGVIERPIFTCSSS